MKKNIPNYEALLILHASKGDGAAFYSLIVSNLKIQYLRMVEDGIEHSEASSKLCNIASVLFKKFIGAQPEDFASWIKASGEIENLEPDYSASNKVQNGQSCFVHELQLHLLRTAGALHQKYRPKNGFFKKFNILSGKAGIVGVAFVAVLISLATIFAFLHYTLKVQLINPKKEECAFVFPFGKHVEAAIQEKKVDSFSVVKSIVKVDSIPIDSIKMDTIVKKPGSKRTRKTFYSNSTESQDSNIVHETNKYNKTLDRPFGSPKNEASTSSTQENENLNDSSENIKHYQQSTW